MPPTPGAVAEADAYSTPTGGLPLLPGRRSPGVTTTTPSRLGLLIVHRADCDSPLFVQS